jgi:trehalose/maltose hydrolase-like predicted phosphorylase
MLEVRSAIDGRVRNNGVERYSMLDDQHLDYLHTDREDDNTICFHVETNQSKVRIAQATRTRVSHNGLWIQVPPSFVEERDFVALDFTLGVNDGDEITIEKVASLYTSRDSAISEPGEQACQRLVEWALDFDTLLERHVVSWRHIWSRTRLELGADGALSRAMHLNVFHIVQTISNNSVGLDVGVPARGLHGEAYRGHVFWDELFILPFLSVRLPQLTRALLLYRYRRLDTARWAAAEPGYEGAMFPWQSASSGRETTQTMHLNPKSGRWLPDASRLQRHVNAAIVYTTWQYYQASGDLEFLRFFGAEMILEIARFWASAASYNHAFDRYEIKGVMGPDEYHEGYPDRDEPGLDNNSYTNLMAVWCLLRAFDVLRVVPPASARDLAERLAITDQELDRWRDIAHKMRVCFHDGVLSQFEGYEQLEDLDLEAYRSRYGDISRLDRILESEGLTTNQYTANKQADVLMLFYLLSEDTVIELLDRLGYDIDDGLFDRCVDYYEPRTVHGSTLSRVVHAWLHARRSPDVSWKLFVEAAFSDLDDVQGGTTKEGIHLGAMSGTLDLVQRAYTGLETQAEVLRLDPVIPDALVSLSFTIRYRGRLVYLEFTPTVARVRLDVDEGGPITVVVRGEAHNLMSGDLIEIELKRQ